MKKKLDIDFDVINQSVDLDISNGSLTVKCSKPFLRVPLSNHEISVIRLDSTDPRDVRCPYCGNKGYSDIAFLNDVVLAFKSKYKQYNVVHGIIYCCDAKTKVKHSKEIRIEEKIPKEVLDVGTIGLAPKKVKYISSFQEGVAKGLVLNSVYEVYTEGKEENLWVTGYRRNDQKNGSFHIILRNRKVNTDSSQYFVEVKD